MLSFLWFSRSLNSLSSSFRHVTAELQRSELTERRQCYCSWKLWIKIWQTCWNHFHAWMNVEEVRGDSWRHIKDFSSEAEAGARVLIGQNPQNCRANRRNIGFGNFLKMMDESLSIFSPAINIFSVCCSHMSVIIQTVMTLLFVFDLHAQTNNYVNLYKLTKWAVISHCSLVTDPETQIQLKFIVSWQPSDTYDCISTKTHFYKGSVDLLDIFMVCKYLGRCLFLLWREKHFYVAFCNQSLRLLLNFSLVHGGQLVWKVEGRHRFVNQTNILKCKAIKSQTMSGIADNLLSNQLPWRGQTCAQVWNDG